MYAITGASGHTGSIVALELLARGKKVRVIGRDPAHLAHLVSRGAEAFQADVADVAALTQAFSGAEAVYVMLPPNLGVTSLRQYQERSGEALVRAIAKASVPKVVMLSSIGADKREKTGPVVGLHSLEQKLSRTAGLDAVYLRAGYFMENLLPQVNIIKTFGFVGGPLSPDLPLPMIATRDIGAAAADYLERLNFSGKQAHELLGQRDVTYNEVAALIGQAIGKPDLRYSQLSSDELKPALLRMGMSSSMASALLEMSESLNSGYMKALERRTPRNTTPTPIESFLAEQFVPLFQGSAAGAR
jgi:uncharacterized protein YbjT (DUF2867 family)